MEGANRWLAGSRMEIECRAAAEGGTRPGEEGPGNLGEGEPVCP